ncbi:cation transporter [Thermoproteota archaeon]
MVDIEKLRLRIIGVSCATCIISIRKKLEKTNGVKSVGFNYITDFFVVYYNPKIISKTKIIQQIKKVGYDAIPMH